jgi:hypothetical protein
MLTFLVIKGLSLPTCRGTLWHCFYTSVVLSDFLRIMLPENEADNFVAECQVLCEYLNVGLNIGARGSVVG